MTNLEVIGLGALNMDHLYRVERILDDGETMVQKATSSPGGSAANTIYSLARLGTATGFCGIIGSDTEGKRIVKDFQEASVDTSHIKIRPKAKTGSVLCLSDSSGKRSLYVLPGANNLLTMEDLDLAYINQAKILHLSSFADDRQFKMSLDVIGKLDPSVRVSFAPGALYASKGFRALAPLLARTHVLFINQSEIRQLTGMNFESGAEACLEQGCKMVAVTLGRGLEIQRETARQTIKRGVSYVRDAKEKYIIEAPGQTETGSPDTTGAGDAFAAGFLYGLLNKKGLEQCGRLGGITAQFSIIKTGARTGLPTIEELSQRYREVYSKEL